MSMTDKLLGIALMIFFITLGFGWGWIMRAIEEKDKAEWVIDYRDCGVGFYHCSKCNLGRAVIDGDYYKSLDEFKRCPICGIKMKGGKE